MHPLEKDADGKRFLQRLEYWRRDWAQAVEDFFRFEPGEYITDQQREVLSSVQRPGSHTTIRSGHGTGKTTTLSWIVLLGVTLYKDCKIPCTAPTAHQLNDILWSEIALWHSKMHPWLRNQIEITSDTVRMIHAGKAPQFAVARTARRENPDALQGFHAKNTIYVVDEASGVPEEVFAPMEGALSTSGSRIVLAGNPVRTSGYFYNTHNKFRATYSRIRLNGEESPLISEEQIMRYKSRYGEDSDEYRIRVLGEFPLSNRNQLIPRAVAEAAVKRAVGRNQYQYLPKVMGIDVSYEGNDSTSVMLRQGPVLRKLGSWKHIEDMDLANLVTFWVREEKVEKVFVDIGWGGGVIALLRQAGAPVVPVNFGSRSRSPRYADKRTEMWCEMAEWLKEGSIPDDVDLIEDLIGPDIFRNTGNMKLKLEDKKSMAKRGLPSPDDGDAAALTFAYPLHVRTETLGGTGIVLPPTVSDISSTENYDVFSDLDNLRF